MLVVSSCSSNALSNVKKLNIIVKCYKKKKKDPRTLSQGLMVSVLHQHDQNLSWSC